VLAGDAGYQMNLEDIFLAPMPGETASYSIEGLADYNEREKLKGKQKRYGEYTKLKEKQRQNRRHRNRQDASRYPALTPSESQKLDQFNQGPRPTSLTPKESKELATEAPSGDYNFGKLRVDFEKGDWGIKFGSWGRENSQIGKAKIAPPSGLNYNSHGIVIPGVNAQLRMDGYFQVGHDIDPVPPLSYLIPFWNSTEFTNEERPTGMMKTGKGVAFGLKYSVDFNSSMGPFEASLTAGIGGDLTIRKQKFRCKNFDAPTDEIGFKGWFAKGQAYGYFGGGLDMNYDFWFGSGKVEIFEVKAFVGVQAQLINPSYFAGFIYGEYSVLDGLLDGSVNYEFQLGDKCKTDLDGNPVAGLEIISEITPYSEGFLDAIELSEAEENELDGIDQSSKREKRRAAIIDGKATQFIKKFTNAKEGKEGDISIFSTPEIITNVSLKKPLSFPEYDEDGKVTSYTKFLPRLKRLEFFDENNRKLDLGFDARIKQDGYGLIITLDKILKPSTVYKIEAVYVFQTKGENGWKDFEFKPENEPAQVFEEKKITVFKTGEFPDEVNTQMLTQQAPGFR